MSKVKQVCLSVAAAGVLAGVGAGVVFVATTSIAHAEDGTGQSAADAGAESAKAGARSPSRGPSRARTPDAATDSQGEARPGPRDSATPAADRRADQRPDRPAGAGPAAGTAATSRSLPPQDAQRRPAPGVNDITDAPSATGAAEPAPIAPTAASSVTAAVPVTPAPEPLVVPSLPAPVVPVLPASAVAPTGSAATTRRRTSAAAAQVAVPTSESPTHVLLIGIDGVNLGAVLDDPANVNFLELMSQGVTGASTMVGHTTLSGPSWTAILAGVWDNKSGVINNIFNPAPYDSWPTVFNLLEYHDPAIETAVVADWKFINQIAEAGAYPVDDPVFVLQVPGDEDWSQTDAEVTADTVALINATDPTTSSFVFSYLVQVDEASHQHGAASPEYAEAIRRADTDLGQILDAVSQWEAATGGDWTVLLTTDHGQQAASPFGHGFQTPVETATFVIADFAGDVANDGKQNLAYSTVDITPTILELFGVPQRSDFDGVPMQSDPFVLGSIVSPADLKQSLMSAMAAFGYPDIPLNLALSVRTIFGAIPYYLDLAVNAVVGQLQAVVDQQIVLVSALAEVAKVAVEITGDLLVGATQALARVVGYLTGAGTIPPTDPPLPPPTSASEYPRTVLASAVYR